MLSVTAARLVRSVGMRMRIVMLLVAVAVLAGCGGDDEAGGAAAAATPEPLTGAIRFETVGGDAFREDAVTVETDGRIRVRTRWGERSATLTAAERKTLADAVAQAELAEAESEVSDPPVPDGLWFRVTYRGRKVETDTGTLDQHEQLQPLVGTFMRFVERYGATR